LVVALGPLGTVVPAALGGAWFLAVQVPPGHRPSSTWPTSLVRVPREEQELKEAVSRAVAYQDGVADAPAQRIDHYRDQDAGSACYRANPLESDPVGVTFPLVPSSAPSSALYPWRPVER
jgi:hypothetical protein